jgi:NADPH2:quinone reductase
MRQTKVVVTRYGRPEVITLSEQECPSPKPGEVRGEGAGRRSLSLPDVLARRRTVMEKIRQVAGDSK